MKRILTHFRISRIIAAIVFSMVVFSGSVMAQAWGIYDGSVVPNASVPVFQTSSGTYYPDQNVIIDDLDNPGNKFLRMLVPAPGEDPILQTGFLWRMNFANLGVTVTDLTLVMRAKGDPSYEMTFDIDIHYNDFRSRLSLFTATKLLDIRNGTGTDITLGAEFDPTVWNTYRITQTSTEVNVYINEDATPVLTFTPQSSSGSNRHFRFGDGDSGKTFGADIDWVIWDVSGAYAPGAGAPIPDPVVSPSWNANLSELNVDGNLIDGFSASTLNYEVVLPLGTVTVPTVTAVAEDTEATVLITPAASIPGTTSILVTAENEITTKTYNVAFRIVSQVATLSSISVDGAAIAGFNPAVFEYTVHLPLETTVEIPVVTATATHPNAVVDITQATTVDGEATILVTAEDGETEQTYTVNFVLVSTDATLSDLLIDGVSVTDFDPEMLEYFVFLPEGTTEPPVVTAVTNNENATLEITQATEIPGTATVLVTAEDGDTQETYSVTFLTGSGDATLSDLLVDGVTIDGFDPDVTDYYLLFPSEVVDVPEVTAVANDENATVVIVEAVEIPGVSTVTVTAEDNFTVKVYSVHMRYASSDSSLEELLINGYSIFGFDPEVLEYNITMPINSTLVPEISAIASDELATVEITPATEIPGATLVVVTAEDGEAVSTYTINFVEGEYDWYYYDANVLPFDQMPNFITSSSDYNPAESIIIDDPEIEGNKLLWMDLPNNSTQFYWRMNFVNQNLEVEDLTVVLRLKGHPDRDMALDIDLHYNDLRARVSLFNVYQEVNNFARIRNGVGTSTGLSVDFQEWNTYRFTMNANEVNLYVNENPIPELTFEPAVATSTNRHFRFGDGDSGANFGADIDWVVWDISGAYAPGEGLFVPGVVVTPNWDATLDELTLDGVLIDGFDPEITEYQVIYTEEPATLPVVSAVTNFEGATLEIAQATTFPDTAFVEVTAYNGFTTKTYSVIFRLVSDDATLANLLFNGTAVADFDPEVYVYDVVLPSGTTTLPVVTAVANDENASVEIEQVTALPGTATVTVTAEDGETELVYEINFTVDPTSASVTDISRFKLYPNPATTNLNIEWEDAVYGADLRIICTSGRVMYSKKVENQTEVIDISKLTPGVYIIHIVSNKTQTRKLFIKQ